MMKKIAVLLFISCIFYAGAFSYSEEIDELNAKGDSGSKLLIFGGYHTHLYGYTDKRYVDKDKGDYLKTNAQYYGIEYYKTDFKEISSMLDDIRFGGNMLFQYIGPFSQRDLYAVPSQSIPAESFPSDQLDRVSKFQINVGIFSGIRKKLYGIDVGISMISKGYDEKTRRRYDAGGNIVEGAGRGFTWDDVRPVGNFLIMLGTEKGANFTFSAFREDYDITYGWLQSKVTIPISSFFVLRFGGYLYPTAGLFLQPELRFSGFTLSVKAGTIVNYYAQKFSKVGITESMILSAAASKAW